MLNHTPWTPSHSEVLITYWHETDSQGVVSSILRRKKKSEGKLMWVYSTILIYLQFVSNQLLLLQLQLVHSLFILVLVHNTDTTKTLPCLCVALVLVSTCNVSINTAYNPSAQTDTALISNSYANEHVWTQWDMRGSKLRHKPSKVLDIQKKLQMSDSNRHQKSPHQY